MIPFASHVQDRQISRDGRWVGTHGGGVSFSGMESGIREWLRAAHCGECVKIHWTVCTLQNDEFYVP